MIQKLSKHFGRVSEVRKSETKIYGGTRMQRSDWLLILAQDDDTGPETPFERIIEPLSSNATTASDSTSNAEDG